MATKKGKKTSVPQQPFETADAAAPEVAFPIAAVGASAGGLEPFLEILRALPAAPGIAVVFVLHQGKHNGVLAHVISRASKMPVVTVANGMVVRPNHVYVAPPAAEVAIEKGILTTRDRSSGERILLIDSFFRSLASDQTDRAIAIVLSGADSDGARGSLAVKGEGGITFAQDDSAAFPHMPRAAVAAGGIDLVLPPREIAAELLRIARRLSLTDGHLPPHALGQVFQIVNGTHDVDFTLYKPSTVERRIRRRMALHKAETLADYVEILRADPVEVEQLYADILIRVTGFFRDAPVFEMLRRDVLPALLETRSNENPVRVWVPGCATGEEVYSLAIVLLEAVADLGSDCPIQIFGTDISDAAIDHARLAAYPEDISGEVSPERLRRFFTKVDGSWRVAKAVRDCCVFAWQNLTKDPPLSKLDLVSCRNVMIYLGAVLQRKVMSIFHYSLKPNGYLLLGSSETIGNYGDLFSVVDRKHRIYRKKLGANPLTVAFEAAAPREREARDRMADEEVAVPMNVFREADRVMLTRFSPPGVLINESMDVVQFRGRTSSFLEPPSGAASFNVLKMAREGLLADLRAAIYAARKSESPVRREAVSVKTNGGTTTIDIEVIPFVTTTNEHYHIVLFHEAKPQEPLESAPGKRKRKAAAEPQRESAQEARLKRELEATRDYLQSIIEEQEAMNEELRSANEEIQSSNEELQGTNEELETAKEELQSSNEELTTLNEELENRNQELAEANNDLINLLGSVDLPIVMLDNSLRIRRFNPGAQRTLNLIPSDIGRPIHDMKLALIVEDLDRIIMTVIDSLEMRELGLKDRHGRSYSLRIRPYKTVDNKIEGAVLVLIDLDQLREAAEAALSDA